MFKRERVYFYFCNSPYNTSLWTADIFHLVASLPPKKKGCEYERQKRFPWCKTFCFDFRQSEQRTECNSSDSSRPHPKKPDPLAGYYKTDMLLIKISRQFMNSRISSPSIDTSRLSRTPYCSFKSLLKCQNPHSESLCCHCQSIRTLIFKKMQCAILVNQARLCGKIEWLCFSTLEQLSCGVSGKELSFKEKV